MIIPSNRLNIAEIKSWQCNRSVQRLYCAIFSYNLDIGEF